METQTIAAAVYHRLLRRLDYCPAWLALPVGIGVGVLGAAAVLTWTPAVVGAALSVLLLGGAARLAWSGEPVARLAEVPTPAPRVPGLEMVRYLAGCSTWAARRTKQAGLRMKAPCTQSVCPTFEMMRVPVTRRLYQEIMQPDAPIPDTDERLVTAVSWFDAIQFCNRLSEHQGCAPCYRIDGNNVQWEPRAQGYRLPTEAEWEYACRAGTQSRFFCGDDDRTLDRYAWYDANSQDAAQPVGRKASNPWGLLDMHGNVWEWCWDWYGPYDEHQQTDPTGPPDLDICLFPRRCHRSVLCHSCHASNPAPTPRHCHACPRAPRNWPAYGQRVGAGSEHWHYTRRTLQACARHRRTKRAASRPWRHIPIPPPWVSASHNAR